MKELSAWAAKPGPDHYPGKALPSCDLDDPKATLFMVKIGGTIFSGDTPHDIWTQVREILNHAYRAGREDERSRVRDLLGLN